VTHATAENPDVNIDDIITALHVAVRGEYATYAPVLKKHERALHRLIKAHPDDVRAVSLLAMVKCELRKNTRTYVRCLEKTFNDCKDTLSDGDYALLATNLSYFYAEECSGKEKRVAELSESAIRRGSPYWETYHALALRYYRAQDFSRALPLFRRTAELSALPRHRYNYAVCLQKCGFAADSIAILRTLSTRFAEHEYDAKAYYALGVFCAQSGDTDTARGIAYDLTRVENAESYVDFDELAELMYAVGEYEQCVKLYDSDRLYETADWMSHYLYSLKSIGNAQRAAQKIADSERDIRLAIDDKTPDDFGGDEKACADYIERESTQLSELRRAYDDVFTRNITPKHEIEIPLLCVCYYIGCPRHSQ
jgi:tetratricopeptide (TPR) repeat protein